MKGRKHPAEAGRGRELALRRMTLLNRIALFLAAFLAALLLQMGVSYYQSRFIIRQQEERTRTIRTISQFLNDAEGCIQALGNYHWDYGDTQALIETLHNYENSSLTRVEGIDTTLSSGSEEQYLLANAVVTTYGTYRRAVAEIAEALAANRTDEAVTAYYETAQPCGDYMRSYTQQLLEQAIQDSQSAYQRLEKINERMNFLQIVTVAVCLFSGGAMVTALFSLLRRVREMAVASQAISQGNLDIPDVGESTHDEIGLMAAAFNEMKRSMKRQVQTLEEKNRMQRELYRKSNEALEMRSLMEQVKLEQLRSQINPHFLLNTMSVIHYTARQEGAERTQALIFSLGKLFRYALGSNEAQVPLSQEIAIINQLYTLYHARFGEQIHLVWEAEPQLDLTCVIVPSFILQPLVENALAHGVAHKADGGTVRVNISTREGLLWIQVRDDGVGMDAQTLARVRQNLLTPSEAGEHVGLYNVAARLRLLDRSGKYALTIDSAPETGTTAELRLPLIIREEEQTDDEDTDC